MIWSEAPESVSHGSELPRIAVFDVVAMAANLVGGFLPTWLVDSCLDRQNPLCGNNLGLYDPSYHKFGIVDNQAY